MKRAGLLSSEYQNPLMKLPASELKHRLTLQGISSHGCLEKNELVERLMNHQGTSTTAAIAVGDSNERRPTAIPKNNSDRKVSAHCDPYGPLQDGETTTFGDKSYKIKRTGQTYYCSCPAWKWQKTAPGSGRTCKHINELSAGFLPNHVGNGPARSGGSTSKKCATGSKSAGSGSKSSSSPKTANKKKATNSSDDNIEVTLAETYTPAKHDPTGYYMSEKLDGMRCVWDGKDTLWTRNGNQIPAPQWFLDALPTNTCLDGELFLGRERFQELMSIRGSTTDPRWSQIQFVVFDAPKVQGDFSTRLNAIQNALKNVPRRIAYPVQQTICRGKAHVDEEHERIIALKGEGVTLRNPKASYEQGRTKNLLKLKRWHDAEATVVGYTAGKGKHSGRLGALQCAMIPSGKKFSIGGGFKDAERQNDLYPIGSTVTYSYQSLTDGGVPRFPKFLRARAEE